MLRAKARILCRSDWTP